MDQPPEQGRKSSRAICSRRANWPATSRIVAHATGFDTQSRAASRASSNPSRMSQCLHPTTASVGVRGQHVGPARRPWFFVSGSALSGHAARSRHRYLCHRQRWRIVSRVTPTVVMDKGFEWLPARRRGRHNLTRLLEGRASPLLLRRTLRISRPIFPVIKRRQPRKAVPARHSRIFSLAFRIEQARRPLA